MAFFRMLWNKATFDYAELAEKMASKVSEHLTNDTRPLTKDHFPPPLNDIERPSARAALVREFRNYFKVHDEKASGINLSGLTKATEDDICNQLALDLYRAAFVDEKDIVSDNLDTLRNTLNKKILQNANAVNAVFALFTASDFGKNSIAMGVKDDALKEMFFLHVKSDINLRNELYFKFWEEMIYKNTVVLLSHIFTSYGEKPIKKVTPK